MRYLTITLTLIILAIVELLIRTDTFYEIAPISYAQAPLTRTQVAFDLVQNPKVIVLGDSIQRDALSIHISRKHSILNIAQSGAVMSDQEWLYIQFRDKMRNANTLVVSINERQFDDTTSSIPRFSTRFRRYASLTQRSSINNRADKISLLVGYFWKSWDARNHMYGTMLNIRAGREGRDSTPKLNSEGRILFPEQQKKLERAPTEESIRVVAPTNYQFVKGIQYKAFQSLLRMAKEDSLDIILIEAPASWSYRDQVNLNIGPEISKLYEALELETSTTLLKVHLTDNDCTLAECFIDFGHMTSLGSNIYSDKLISMLQTSK